MLGYRVVEAGVQHDEAIGGKAAEQESVRKLGKCDGRTGSREAGENRVGFG